jgi:glycolate oxidase iron-sulfur subunit
MDVSVFLEQLDMPEVPPLPQPLRVAYQSACHLEHAQGIVAEPRRLLGRVPNLTLVELDDGGKCCGSAGTYNLEQPELAGQLGEAKARAVERAAVDAVASGNIGCLVQLRMHLQLIGSSLPAYHTIELLDQAFGTTSGSA